MATMISSTHDEESDSDGSDFAFSSIDMTGVNFDAAGGSNTEVEDLKLSEEDGSALQWEREMAFSDFSSIDCDMTGLPGIRSLGKYLALGKYADVLRSEPAQRFFQGIAEETEMVSQKPATTSLTALIRQQVLSKGDSIESCIELELIGISAFNLFLQSNYTGPSFDADSELIGGGVDLAGIDPHPCFSKILKASEGSEKSDEKSNEEKKEMLTAPQRNAQYQNAVLAELAVDGEWPCQVCQSPYFLLLARSIFIVLADPHRPDWSHPGEMEDEGETSTSNNLPVKFVQCTSKLAGAKLWNARAVVAHERLLAGRQPSVTLWNEAKTTFQTCLETFCCSSSDSQNSSEIWAATVSLEWGLGQHHFDREGKGKASFSEAQKYSGLMVEVTGAKGKRTKFQQDATAQMIVRATSSKKDEMPVTITEKDKSLIKGQMVEHSEEEILLENINFENEADGKVDELSTLDQAILLALCLDVKNSNPADGLTAEEMGAFLARVLRHHNDWMIYSTGLLERSWLEFERSHGRERAILQMQALADQHTNQLTITQSTKKSIDESSPVQDRLKNLHSIVYPPRWEMIRDIADRYASLGLNTSAAELYTEVELWDDVVDCYQSAGKVSTAEQIVRERLTILETPRMWSALGDLTSDPEHYNRAIELSRGKFSKAYVALGHYYFEKGNRALAVENYEKALRIRPLETAIWFRLGTIRMQLDQWEKALQAFSEVVQQEPEEGDAWANVAAIHLHNKNSAEAYPALVEALKFNRNNWRVWSSKLYACLDLEKYDEAIQACNNILNIKSDKQGSNEVPPLEEKCVRAIVGGVLKRFQASSGNEAALDSSRRSLSRTHDLLDRISASSDVEPWVFEIMAFFHQQVGEDEKVLENLMKEYRSILTIQAWEKDNVQLPKMCQVVSHIAYIHRRKGSRESLSQSMFLVRSVVGRIKKSLDDTKLPEEVDRLAVELRELEEELKKKPAS